jgi:hypothetical protein
MMSNIATSPQRLISRYGRTVTYRKVLEGVYNPSTSSITNTETSFNVLAFKTNTSFRESQSPSIVGKEAVVFLIAGTNLAFTPELGDKIRDFENKSFQVKVVSRVEVQQVVSLWRLVCISA